MESAINFRDFGGHPSRYGGTVREDRLYRCGHLAAIAPNDIERLLGLDFALIADLRYAHERNTDRSPWPAAYAPRLFAHSGSRSSDAPHIALLKWIGEGNTSMHQRTIAFYRKMPFNRHYRPLFVDILNKLAALDGRVLIHCTAGKDRTGILAALILHALGVSRDAIIADYMRSGQSQAGSTHTVQYRTNLIAGLNWQTYSNVTGDGALKTIPVPRSVFSPAQQGFIRVQSQ